MKDGQNDLAFSSEIVIFRVRFRFGRMGGVFLQIIPHRLGQREVQVRSISRYPPTPADSKGERVRAERLLAQQPSITIRCDRFLKAGKIEGPISRAVARCKVARLKPSKQHESYAKGSQKIAFFQRYQKQR